MYFFFIDENLSSTEWYMFHGKCTSSVLSLFQKHIKGLDSLSATSWEKQKQLLYVVSYCKWNGSAVEIDRRGNFMQTSWWTAWGIYLICSEECVEISPEMSLTIASTCTLYLLYLPFCLRLFCSRSLMSRRASETVNESILPPKLHRAGSSGRQCALTFHQSSVTGPFHLCPSDLCSHFEQEMINRCR